MLTAAMAYKRTKEVRKERMGRLLELVLSAISTAAAAEEFAVEYTAPGVTPDRMLEELTERLTHVGYKVTPCADSKYSLVISWEHAGEDA